jgi:hypothetical protein
VPDGSLSLNQTGAVLRPSSRSSSRAGCAAGRGQASLAGKKAWAGPAVVKRMVNLTCLEVARISQWVTQHALKL